MNSDRRDSLLPVPAEGVVLRWASELYDQSVDRKDAAGFAAAFIENGSLQFANNPAIHGRAAIQAAISEFFQSFVALRHEARGAFFTKDTLILEAVVTYTRHDGQQVTISAVTIFHLAGAQSNDPQRPLADDCRIYVDLTPLYEISPSGP
ncbi:MAG: nuclear transport factor 2 family protein [Chthoniobacterales bacterium]